MAAILALPLASCATCAERMTCRPRKLRLAGRSSSCAVQAAESHLKLELASGHGLGQVFGRG